MTAELSVNPFPGLRAFEADEQDLFFGREGQSEEILRRLREQRFVAVVGTSGSGKSSLVRAGLLPYLHGGFLPDTSSHWCVALFRPGANPIKNLATALDDPAALGQTPQAVSAPQAENGASALASSASQGTARASVAAAQSALLLEVTLRRGGLGLIEAVQLARLPPHRQLLIVVDQFEELFRFAEASDRPGRNEDAAGFVKLLVEASRQRELPIYVVVTMRSDYIGDCARYRDLPEAVTNGLYLIPRMTREQWRAAIIGPVRVSRGTIAPRLVVRLLNDVGDDPDQLPILQHALMRTWDCWRSQGDGERPIDIKDYLAIGGMAEALSRHADETYDGLPDDRARTIAEGLFKALSEKGPDNREARRPTKLDILAKVIDAPIGDVVRVIDDFRAPGRTFLTPATGALNGDTVIDISHESLIRGWQRMRQWVEDEAQSARDYRRLAETALLYGQGKAGLLPERDLNNALAWCDRERPNAAWAELYHPGFEQAMAFLEQSRLARDTDRSQKQAIRRRLQFVGGAITVVMAIVAALALWQRHQATNERERAQKGYTLATQLANNLTFNAMQDFGLHGFPAEARAIANQTIRDYNELIKLDPTAGAYNGRGWAYVTKQDYDRAIADFDKAIELDPKYTPAYNNRGNVYRDKGDYDKAIANLNQAIALNPKYRLSFNNRCLAYIGKKDYDHAIADCTQAIALYPKYLTAYNNRGFAYYGKGDYDKAIADLNQAIVLDPKYARPYYNRALAYERKSDYRHAIADYSKFITLAPENPAALSELCWDRVIIGWLQAALQDCNQSLALRPNNAATLNSRGFAYLRLGQFDNAIADYNAALKINPKQANALYGRGVAETKMGNAVAGNTDIAAAKAMQADVADRMASLGITF